MGEGKRGVDGAGRGKIYICAGRVGSTVVTCKKINHLESWSGGAGQAGG